MVGGGAELARRRGQRRRGQALRTTFASPLALVPRAQTRDVWLSAGPLGIAPPGLTQTPLAPQTLASSLGRETVLTASASPSPPKRSRARWGERLSPYAPSVASPTISVKPRRAFHGWRILAFATLTAALTGPGQTVGVSVFIDHIIEDLSLTRSQVSTAYLIGTMLGALSLPTVGRWVDRVGARPAITTIGAGFAVALVAMSGVGGFVTLAIGFTFIRFLGQGSLSLASTVAVTHWFERRRGLAIGIYATFTSMLMGLTPVGLNFVIESSTWRTAWIVAGVFIALTVVPIGR